MVAEGLGGVAHRLEGSGVELVDGGGSAGGLEGVLDEGGGMEGGGVGMASLARFRLCLLIVSAHSSFGGIAVATSLAPKCCANTSALSCAVVTGMPSALCSMGNGVQWQANRPNLAPRAFILLHMSAGRIVSALLANSSNAIRLSSLMNARAPAALMRNM